MNNTLQSAVDSTRRFRDVPAWRSGIWKNAMHSASSSVLLAISTNGAEGLAPALFPNMGMDLRQMAAAFAFALFHSSLHYVNQATKPGNTGSPFSR